MRRQNLLFVGACLNNLPSRFLFYMARNVIIVSETVQCCSGLCRVSECLWLILFIDLSLFILYFKNCKYSEISFQITNHVLKSQIRFSNCKSSLQITNQVQNQFVFKSRTPNSLVTDPSVLDASSTSMVYRWHIESRHWISYR